MGCLRARTLRQSVRGGQLSVPFHGPLPPAGVGIEVDPFVLGVGLFFGDARERLRPSVVELAARRPFGGRPEATFIGPFITFRVRSNRRSLLRFARSRWA